MSVKAKLYASFLLIIVLLILTGAYSIYSLGEVSEVAESLAQTSIPKIQIGGELSRMVANYRILQYRHIIETSQEQMSNEESRMLGLEKDINDRLEAGKRVSTMPEAAEELQKNWNKYLEVSKKMQELSRQNRSSDAMAIMDREGRSLFDDFTNDLNVLIENNKQTADNEMGLAVAVNKKARMVLFIAIVTAILISIAVTVYMSKFIENFIRDFLKVSNKIAEGDLKEKMIYSATDEFGEMSESFNTTVKNLQRLLKEVQKISEQLAASSEELVAGADQSALMTTQIAQSAEQSAESVAKQSEEVQAVSAAVEKISMGVNDVSANALTISSQASQTIQTVSAGTVAVKKAITQMEKIREKVSRSSQTIEDLENCSKEIGIIVDTISGIAAQTNLLALNAAIEAASAGEHGRGFAVVAEEVRTLAEQSRQATKNIAELIGRIQSETQRAVAEMHEGTQEVKGGTVIVYETGQAFEEIRELINIMAQQVGGISSVVSEVATETQSIVTFVQSIGRTSYTVSSETQRVSEAVEEQSASMQGIAAASQGLSQMAQNLQNELNRFQV